MGARGPAPKPTALRLVRGDPSHRPLPPGEPKPRLGVPTCPKELDSAAKAEWRRIVEEYRRAAPQLLTQLDGGELALYCQSRARWLHAEADIAADLATGKTMDRFKVVIATKYAQQMRQSGDRLGLSPASRSRLSLPDRPTSDDDFLDGR